MAKKRPRDRDRWRSKIAGVTFRNADGADRQRILSRCNVGDELRLVREPANPRSRRAIRLEMVADSDQLGYVGADLADDLAPLLDDGWRMRAWITDLTGGTDDKPTRGANILIVGAAGSVEDAARVSHFRDTIDAAGLRVAYRDPWARSAESEARRPVGVPYPPSDWDHGGLRLIGRDLARWFGTWPEWLRWAFYGLVVALPVIGVLAALLRR